MSHRYIFLLNIIGYTYLIYNNIVLHKKLRLSSPLFDFYHNWVQVNKVFSNILIFYTRNKVNDCYYINMTEYILRMIILKIYFKSKYIAKKVSIS